MPRCGGIRRYCREIADSPRVEKIAFVPPFAILTAELILLYHALNFGEGFVILLTLFLLMLSLIELFLILREIHEHRKQTNFERELAIRLDDFIIERHMDNVSNKVSTNEVQKLFVELNGKIKTLQSLLNISFDRNSEDDFACFLQHPKAKSIFKAITHIKETNELYNTKAIFLAGEPYTFKVMEIKGKIRFSIS